MADRLSGIDCWPIGHQLLTDYWVAFYRYMPNRY
ncbi:hypothetical protein M2243_002282 [Heliophilum fasciatum]|nr:hypothetical protein [Heliophilum fasciatum]